VISLESIREAKDKLKKIINTTPLQFSQTFTDLTKSPIFMKPECLQKKTVPSKLGAHIPCCTG